MRDAADYEPTRPTCFREARLRRCRSRVGFDESARAIPSKQGPPHAFLREEERDPPHPRCLPSMGAPARGRFSPRVADNLWIRIGAFSIRVVVPPS